MFNDILRFSTGPSPLPKNELNERGIKDWDESYRSLWVLLRQGSVPTLCIEAVPWCKRRDDPVHVGFFMCQTQCHKMSWGTTVVSDGLCYPSMVILGMVYDGSGVLKIWFRLSRLSGSLLSLDLFVNCFLEIDPCRCWDDCYMSHYDPCLQTVGTQLAPGKWHTLADVESIDRSTRQPLWIFMVCLMSNQTCTWGPCHFMSCFYPNDMICKWLQMKQLHAWCKILSFYPPCG